jgi:hypothetical protein
MADSTQDEHQIAQLLYAWAHARDYGDWDALERCFHDGATIHIAWISGLARDYVYGSRNAAPHTVEAHSKHLISNPLIKVAGDRALSICHATLHVRRTVAGVAVDLESFMRFFDLLERRDGRWGLVKRTGVYEKDRLASVDPRGFPADFFNGVDLAQFPPAKKFLSFLQFKAGTKSRDGFVSAFSPEEDAVRAEGLCWISVA